LWPALFSGLSFEDDAIIKTLPVGGPTHYETLVARGYVDAKMASINVA
jgi:hypothetical protein